jgi:hypothetical protein
MIEQCSGLTSKDVDIRSHEFITSLHSRYVATGGASWMTEPQIKWLADIWSKHFS